MTNKGTAYIPSNSGKYSTKCENIIFSSNKSFLFKNNMMEEFWNHGYVIIVRNNALLSSMRFWKIKRTRLLILKTFWALFKILINRRNNICSSGQLKIRTKFLSWLLVHQCDMCTIPWAQSLRMYEMEI